MPEKALIKDLHQFEGKAVQLKGWACQFRSSGKISFLVLRDGTGYCQCVFAEGRSKKEAIARFSELSLEASAQVEGQVKKWRGGFEIEAESLQIIAQSQPPYPLGKKSHGPDFLLSRRHLWLRSKRQAAVMRIRSGLIRHIRGFFHKEGFLPVDAPLLTFSSCEGTSSLFSVDFFDHGPAYLSQSGQLHMEAAAAAYGKVYCFGPTFRAEKSSTRRHLLEFWMIEPEMAFQNLEEAMETAENFIEYAVQKTLESEKDSFKALERDTGPLEKIKAPFPRLSYGEAAEILQKESPGFQKGKDFGGGDETVISSRFERPVFVHRYPREIKAFYMKTDPKDKGLSLSFDLLATEGYGEIIGGGQREDSLEALEAKIKEHGLDQKRFEWYLDLRRFGSFPHSGFGLGLERLVCWVCGLSHVREAIPFPRLYGRAAFDEGKSPS